MVLLIFSIDPKEARALRQVLCWVDGVHGHWVQEERNINLTTLYHDPIWFDFQGKVKDQLELADKSGWVLVGADGVVMEKGKICEVSRLGEFLLRMGLTKSCRQPNPEPSAEKPLYVYTHLGLGDLIICQGIIRNLLCGTNRPVRIFTKPKFSESVRFLYRDLNRLEILEMDDAEAQVFLQKIPLQDQVIIGHDILSPFLKQGLAFDHAFYECAGLDFSRRWSDFRLIRDSEAEKRIFNHFRVPEANYVFLHEDTSRKLRINRNHIYNSNLPIVEPQPGLTGNIFDYLYLMENACEIHCIDSCFRLMADTVLSDRQGLCFHQQLLDGVRKDARGLFSSSRLSWAII
jgi:hypothetical protein